MKIYGVYFIALMLDNWFDIVNDQLQTLLNSKLFSKTEKLYIRIFYEKNSDLEKLKKLIPNLEKIIISYTNKNEYEYGALKIIKNLSEDENFYCYYLHSKGVSLTEKTYGKHKLDIKYETMKNSIHSWRKYMEHFLINEYEKCIDSLSSGFDACGVQLRGTPRTNLLHFSGNFWWTKSDYVKKLPKIEDLDNNNRNLAEFWIGYGHGKYKNLYFTKQAGYREIITENYK